MLRRRRREDDEQGSVTEEQEPARHLQHNETAVSESGPWDAADAYPRTDRLDCGSLLVPVRDGFEVQLNVGAEDGSWVALVHGESGMQLQAFAAPRSGGLWDDVRQEIAANIVSSGGDCQEEEGQFGTELHAQVPLAAADEQPPEPPSGQPLHPVRFLGIDGPRWFLRGVITGPAATDSAARTPLEEMFADVVVVRGDYPAPQRQQLPIQLPEDIQRAIEAEGEPEENTWLLQDPFTRGPEITETR
ncbi:MAG TPA: DUF3710 domain-containing protein [Streptosporangiaceae bacterium]|nr:DUF3710 domain-containing protein [Streptosporangiaceae bacterium]